MTLPLSLTNWFASAYPSLSINQDWLTSCYAHVTSETQLTGPNLVKAVEHQLLHASLSDVCVAGSLPTEDLSQLPVSTIATQRGGILVEILRVFEIGNSALSIQDAQDSRKEDLKMGVNRARIIGNVEEETNSADDDSKGPTRFPRAMLSFELSDGFITYKAIEYKKLPGISLDDTPLGTKLVLKNVKALRGVLLLEPSCVTIKGGLIEVLNAHRDEILDAEIRRRLGLPELIPEAATGASRNAPTGNAEEVRQMANQQQMAESAGQHVNNQRQSPLPRPEPEHSSRPQVRIGDEDDFYYDEFSDEWDEAIVAEERVRPSRAPESIVNGKDAMQVDEEQRVLTFEDDFGDDLSPEMLAAIQEAEQAHSSSAKAFNSSNVVPSSVPPQSLQKEPAPSSKTKSGSKIKQVNVIDLSSD